jgi:hypothetical protein
MMELSVYMLGIGARANDNFCTIPVALILGSLCTFELNCKRILGVSSMTTRCIMKSNGVTLALVGLQTCS